MFIVLAVCYLLYTIVELSNIDESNNRTMIIMRCALYIGFMLINRLVIALKGNEKFSMIFMAFSFLIMYVIFVMSNSAACMVLIFPALVGFTVYLNSVVVGAGCISAFIACAIKCYIIKASGDMQMFDFANLITIGFVVCIYGSFKTIALLVD